MKELLNSQETYVDDYGNTKMLTIEDHSPKDKVYFNGTWDEQVARYKQEQEEKRAKRIRCIKSIHSDVLHSLLNLYGHIILFDTDTELFQWNESALDSLLQDTQALDFLENIIKDKEVQLFIGDRMVTITTKQKINDSNI